MPCLNHHLRRWHTVGIDPALPGALYGLRHTSGRLDPCRVVVRSAGMQHRNGTALVLDKILQRFNPLKLVSADSGYNAYRSWIRWPRFPAYMVKGPITSRSHRSVGDRAFSWFGRNRRLNKYEKLAQTLATFVSLGTIRLGVRSLAPPDRPLSEILRTPLSSGLSDLGPSMRVH